MATTDIAHQRQADAEALELGLAMHALKDAKQLACARLLEADSVVGHGDAATALPVTLHIDLNARQRHGPRELDGIGESCVKACSSR
jgi:hypothetical protein